MPNIATTFKEEVKRLSRKEIRARTSALRKATVRERRDIAELRREVAKLQQQVSLLQRRLAKGVPPFVSEPKEGDAIRYRKDSVVAHRKRLALSAEDFGKLVGVTGHTVYSWEHGTSKPRRAQLAALAAIRGIGKREAMERLEGMGKKAPKGKAKKKAR